MMLYRVDKRELRDDGTTRVLLCRNGVDEPGAECVVVTNEGTMGQAGGGISVLRVCFENEEIFAGADSVQWRWGIYPEYMQLVLEAPGDSS